MISSIYEIKACPECSGANLSYLNDRDQVVCRDCGLVYEPLTPRDERRLERISGSLKRSKSAKAAKKPRPKPKPRFAPKKPSKKKTGKPVHKKSSSKNSKRR